jgi:hypothetical protein
MGFPSAAMVHKKRRGLKKKNCTVYGINASPRHFQFVEIDDDGVVW